MGAIPSTILDLLDAYEQQGHTPADTSKLLNMVAEQYVGWTPQHRRRVSDRWLEVFGWRLNMHV